MKLSQLNEIPKSRTMVDMFKGYNHNLRIGEGEFYDMTNLSSDNFPILSPRPKRGVYATPTAPQGLVAKDALCYVDGSDFVINEYRVPMGLTIDDEPKTLISMGAYVIIMPDKKWVNTEPKDGETSFEHGSIEATVTTTSAVTFELCKLDGVGYEGAVAQPAAPTSPANMDLWIDTSSTPHTLKQYSATNSMWVPIATTYIKISVDGTDDFFAPLSENDGVTISGIKDEALQDLNSTMVIWAKGYNYIVVTGILDKTTTQEEAITVKRQMPLMDFIIESGNRLWGCHYGVSLNGEVVNEIYASKLGDFKNWNCYAGISTDSYAVTVGSDGQFTGAITHLGYPIFFKETCMHKVYGNYPANYQVQTTACRGVQKGCERSLAIVNEVLYYKARSGVCAFDGSLPTEISAAFGDLNYHDAVAGSLGNKYYVSMSDGQGKWHLFVYDSMKGMWHREDATQAVCFCNCRGDLYYIDYADKQIKTVRGTGVPQTASIKWEAITGIIGTDSPDKKYISRIDVRMLLQVGTRVSFQAEYDSSGVWEHLYSADGVNLDTVAVPVKTRRCDHMRLRIVGTGDAKIFSICKTVEQGSDR
jgi:hypothetical protein